MSSNLKISSITWNKIQKKTLPGLKSVVLVPTINAEGVEIIDGHSLSSRTDYKHPLDENEQLELNMRVGGYRYGAQCIPIQGGENFTMVGAAGITLLGI
jgi:hypothetical protein